MTTLFTDQVTLITASWLNATDAIVVAPSVTSIAAVTPVANKVPYFTGPTTASSFTVLAYMRSLLESADLTTFRAQLLDPELVALASLTSSANTLPYFSAAETAALTTFTPFARTVLDDTTGAAMLSTMGGAALAGPTFTGVPAAPTAAVDTNTTQLATTAFVLGQAATVAPVMDGAQTLGTSTLYARQDHVHASDTTRAATVSPTFTGTPAAPTAAADTNTTQIATTAFVLGQAYAKLASPAFTGTVTLPAVTGGGTVALTNNLITTIKTASFNGVVDDGTKTTTATIDFGTGQYHKCLLTASTNITFTFTAPAGPCVVQLQITQAATGTAQVATFPATVKWPGNYAAADKLLSTTANARDLLILRWDGTDYVANLIKAIA